MNLSQVKLVVSDMDGTLLNSKGNLSDLFVPLFKQLKAHNIHFAAASGRQFMSIANKLELIKNEITIIAENGATGKLAGTEEEFVFTNLEFEKIKKIIPILRTIDNAFIVLCGKDSAFVETTNKGFLNLFSEYYVSYKIVKDLTAIAVNDILKIAVFHPENAELNIYPSVKHLEKEMQVKISGKHWVDFSEQNANKGFALKILQEKLGVTEAETMVFGDYNNDLEMLKLSHFSFAMKNGYPNVKAISNYETKSNDEKGVEYILQKLLDAKHQKL